MKRTAINPEALRSKSAYARFEGGTIYTAENGDQFYVIVDESTMSELLSEEDLKGLELVKVLEFNTSEERSAFLAERYARPAPASVNTRAQASEV